MDRIIQSVRPRVEGSPAGGGGGAGAWESISRWDGRVVRTPSGWEHGPVAPGRARGRATGDGSSRRGHSDESRPGSSESSNLGNSSRPAGATPSGRGPGRGG